MTFTQDELREAFIKAEGEVQEIKKIKLEDNDVVYVEFVDYFLGPKKIIFEFYYKAIYENGELSLKYLHDKRGLI